jgi:hypothetical protein
VLTRRPQRVPPTSYNQPPTFNLATPDGLRWDQRGVPVSRPTASAAGSRALAAEFPVMDCE